MDSVKLGVCGVAGCGKTTLSKTLSDVFGLDYVSVKKLASDEGFVVGYDVERDTSVIDVEEVRGFIDETVSGGCVMDFTHAHLLEPSHIIVLRCSPITLWARLTERGYAREKKLENIEAEYMGVLLEQSMSVCDNVYELEGEGAAPIDDIRTWLERGGKLTKEFDWTTEFVTLLENS